VACELWLRGQIASVEDVLLQVARSLTIRLAEKLAQAMSSLMRLAESMVTLETECLLYATYWFRPILSELIGSARESPEVNRSRAPSGQIGRIDAILATCLVFALVWTKTFKWLDVSRSSSMDIQHGSLNHT